MSMTYAISAVVTKRVGLALAGVVAFGLVSAQAQTIVNPSFDSFAGSGLTSQQLKENGGSTGSTYTNWTTTSGYTFITSPSQAINGFGGPSGNLQLWSPTAGAVTGNGGLGSVAITPSPYDIANGQNQTTAHFLTIDPSFPRIGDYVQTSVTGLTIGATYTVSYYTAVGQQKGFTLSGSGQTQQVDNWTIKTYDGVSNVLKATNTQGNIIDADQSFSGWVQQTLAMTATAASMTLQFIANSNVTSGQPPFMLLDGLSATQNTNVPEPSAMALLATGVIGLFGLRRRRARA